jgi:hypothetical protein
MRRAVGARYFPTVRLGAWLLIAVGLIAYRTHSGPEVEAGTATVQHDPATLRVIVSGADSFALLTEPADQGVRRYLELDGTRYPIVDAEDGTSATVKDPAGGVWMVKDHEEGYAISENDQPRFRMKRGDEGYSVRGINGDVVYKAKQKDEKVNLYSGDEQRLRHGKLKNGQVQWKDEQDNVVLRVTGEEPWDSAVLALPISIQARALGWAFQRRTITQ